MRWLWLLLAFLHPVPAWASPDGEVLDVWTRAPGRGAEGDRARLLEQSVVLRDQRQIEASLFDAQLGRVEVYRGINLADLLERLRRPEGVDTILLHFANGMVIPVSLDGAGLAEIFVATAWKVGGGFDEHFPDAPKRIRSLPDPAPITFGRNKVVVPNPEHPLVPKAARSKFSPWAYVDSLTGLEWMQSARWLGQFRAQGEAAVGRGQGVFAGRCQFCHGVAEVGATFGWDLVRPVPLYDYRAPEGLYVHVSVENGQALERGYQMPTQRDVERSEIRDLWLWMKAITAQGPRPY